MHIWSHSLVLTFIICYICSVHSQICHDDLQCKRGKCCLGSCTWRKFCLCLRDTDCSYGEQCLLPSFRCQPTQSVTIPTFQTWYQHPTTTSTSRTYPGYNNCVRDSDCDGSSICKDGQCFNDHRSEEGVKDKWSGRNVYIEIIIFVAVATVITGFYFLLKRARKRPVLAPQNTPTGMTREATTASTTHEMQPGSAVSNNGASGIEMEEGNEGSPPLPAGAPPPYSSLEFEQQPNENDEQEQLPPSYDEAVSETV